MSDEMVSVRIPVGGIRSVNVYFPTSMTSEEWGRFLRSVQTMRDAVVDDRPQKPTVAWGIGGAGGGAGGALPPTGIVSVTTDLRIPSHKGCTCGHMYGVHRLNGTCTRCVTCFRFDGANTEPPCVCGCKKSVHGLSGVCSMCEQCSSYTENVGVPE